MKTIKRTLRLFIVALLAVVFAFSVAACKTGKPKDTVDPDPKPTPIEPLPSETTQYTVSFENVDSAAYPAIKVNKNGTVSVDAPANTDTKIFMGWYMDEECASLPFTMGSTKITQDTTLYACWKTKTVGEVTKRYTVTFNSDGGSAVASQSVEEGRCAFTVTPERAGYQFLGWYIGESKYDFKNVVTKDITLLAKWSPLDAKIQSYGSYSESLYVEWTDGAPSQASVQYKASGDATWLDVDGELIRNVGNSVARVDALGLAAGDYDVKIQPSSGSPIEISDISVAAYDRSGYAHFKYTEGVGAYNDDGTLKDDAIVIYVTDENKDYVMRDAVEKYSELKMFQIPTYSGTTGKDWKNKDAEGIGWWLNNAQYSTSNVGSDKNKRPSNTYDPVNGGKLGFKSVENPIVIRFIGAVTTPEGCTAYANEDEGGNKEDNGHMARMKNLKNVTLEGVGEDAKINGWGFHFMAGSDATNGRGKSFEVRNLIFDKYPEDAVGMEGVQESGRLTGSVERCWIHNNSFLPGYCANPTENDKSEGDGSCDFKRGEYFTCSYNYFVDCHKTNLVGSSDSSLQFNLSYHHNWWYNCGSRIPLARQANIHFYNNYISTDSTGYDGISYVHSIRANAYIFSEANYYFGCKAIADKGGKAWNNTYLGCFGTNNLVDVKKRDEAVSNSCKHYNGTSLSSFDTDPNLFYYNATTKQSDCLLDDSVTARAKAIQYAGVNGWGKNNPKKQTGSVGVVNELMNEKTPTEAVNVPDKGALEVDFSKTTPGIILEGSLSKGQFKSTKGKAQMVTFRLAAPAKVTVGGVSDSYGGPYLIAQNGAVLKQFDSTDSIELPAGIYIICVGCYSYDLKQSSISSLSFESTASSAQAKLDNLNEAINAIGTVTLSSGTAITQAQTLLNALNADEITAFDTAYPGQRDKLTTAQSTYNGLLVQNVETLISAIGTVTDDSYPDIQAARDAYDALSSALKSQVTNYATLTAAETAWANRAVTAINNQITALDDVSGWTVANGKQAITDKKTEYESVKSAYEQLSDKSGIVGYDKVTNGLTKLNGLLADIATAEAQAEALVKFETALSAVTDTSTLTLDECNNIISLYNALSTEKQAQYANDTTYKAIVERQQALASAAVTVVFDESSDDYDSTYGPFTVTKGGQKNASATINGKTFTHAMEINSSAKITINLAAGTTKTLKLYFTSAKDVKVDGKVTGNTAVACTTDENNSGYYVLEITLTGTGNDIVITKDSSSTNLLMIEML